MSIFMGDEFFRFAFGKNIVKILQPYPDFRGPDTNWESHSSQWATGSGQIWRKEGRVGGETGQGQVGGGNHIGIRRYQV